MCGLHGIRRKASINKLDVRMLKKKHVKTFLIWLALLNWPPILFHVPPLRGLCFLPFLFWINIPALWLGLAKLIGKSDYDIQEFGAIPLTPLAWALIASFWILLAAGLTLATDLFRSKLRTKADA